MQPEPLGLMKELEVKYGARNAIVGKLKKINKGSVMCQVEVDVMDPSLLS